MRNAGRQIETMMTHVKNALSADLLAVRFGMLVDRFSIP